MKTNSLDKVAYQETSDEAFLYNYRPNKTTLTLPLPGVNLKEGLSPADIATDNVNPVTSSNSDVVSKYRDSVDPNLPPVKTAMASFLKGFFAAKEEEKKKKFWDNRMGPAEVQRGAPTNWDPGAEIGGGI